MTGPQRKSLIDAVTDAFDVNELGRHVMMSMDVSLAKLVNTNVGFETTVSELIEWAVRQGEVRVTQLLDMVCDARPDNGAVQAAVDGARRAIEPGDTGQRRGTAGTKRSELPPIEESRLWAKCQKLIFIGVAATLAVVPLIGHEALRYPSDHQTLSVITCVFAVIFLSVTFHRGGRNSRAKNKPDRLRLAVAGWGFAGTVIAVAWCWVWPEKIGVIF